MTARKQAAEIFESNSPTISRLWKVYKTQKDAGVVYPGIVGRGKGNSSCKGTNIVECLLNYLQIISIKNLTAQCALVDQVNILSSTLHDNMQNLG
ncbi:unnamed protein product [Choristocarpus tenellus]